MTQSFVVVECEGVHGSVWSGRLMIDKGLNTSLSTFIKDVVDGLAGHLSRTVANVTSVSSVIQNLEELEREEVDVVDATINLLFTGQQSPMTEVNLRFTMVKLILGQYGMRNTTPVRATIHQLTNIKV